MEKENYETILARWLAGTITEEERKELEASGDLALLEKIASKTSHWSLPELDSNSYSKLQEKLSSKKETAVIPLYKNKTVLRIAASVLLIVGLFSVYTLFFMSSTKTYQCEAGQKMDVYLPDKTLVKLNGYSSISFDEKDWSANRNVSLTGEAYFEVYQKGPFAVQFQQGTVHVLGTKFNILSGTSLAVVKCFEGKVSVMDQTQQQELLTPGKALKLYADSTSPVFEINEKNPDWLSNESIFKDAPLSEVINALSIQFNVQFDIKDEKELNRKFTGKFIHTDLETALKMVFPPMSISYSVEGEKRKMVILH